MRLAGLESESDSSTSETGSESNVGHEASRSDTEGDKTDLRTAVGDDTDASSISNGTDEAESVLVDTNESKQEADTSCSVESDQNERNVDELPEYVTFASPLTLQERALNVLRSAHETGKVVAGKSEVERAIQRTNAELVYIAEDVEPQDIIQHIPELAEERNTPYIFIENQKSLIEATELGGANCSSAAIVSPGESAQELDNIISKIENIQEAS